jgi:hypothetical protein
MTVAKGENLVYSSKDSHSLSNKKQRILSTCRLANHHISAQRVTITDYNTHYDKIGNADQYIFIVRCHRCNSEWIELWRTSKWFTQNNNNKKTTSPLTMRGQFFITNRYSLIIIAIIEPRGALLRALLIQVDSVSI